MRSESKVFIRYQFLMVSIRTQRGRPAEEGTAGEVAQPKKTEYGENVYLRRFCRK